MLYLLIYFDFFFEMCVFFPRSLVILDSYGVRGKTAINCGTHFFKNFLSSLV